MSGLGPGDVVDGRYELVRALGGGDLGRVYVALDRPLDRRVALRIVAPGDRAAAAALLEETRRMTSVQYQSLNVVSVLDEGSTPDGTRYVAMELVEGTPLDEVVRRGPVPAPDAVRIGIELLDACLAVRRGGPDPARVVPATALLTSDGHVRVTRFADAAGPGPAGAEPAVAHVAAIVRDLAGGRDPGAAGVPEPSAALAETLDDALAGRVRSAGALRNRLHAVRGLHERAEEPVAGAPPARRRAWPLVLVSLGLLAVIATIVVLVVVAIAD